MLHFFVQRKPNINISALDGTTPLHVACANNHIESFRILLSENACVNARTNDGETPLHIVSRKGHKTMLECLLEKSADPFAVTNNGANALHLACKYNNYECMNILLNHVDSKFSKSKVEDYTNTNIDEIYEGEEENLTPLYFAYKNENQKMIIDLIKYGANINRTFVFDQTFLISACKSGNLEFVNCFLHQSANPNITECDRKSPLYFACELGHDDIVFQLVEHGADVNICSYQGYSPLYFACVRNNKTIVHLLLNHGADANVLSEEMESLLVTSCKNGYKEIVDLLLEFHADVNFCHYEGETPLYFAFEGGYSKIMKSLLQYGADWNICAHEREFYLYQACKNGNLEIVILMLNHDKTINVNSRLLKGETPLHGCCQNCCMEVAIFLIDNGADINLQSAVGETAFSELCIHGGQDEVKVILEKCSINQTSLHRGMLSSCISNKGEILTMLIHQFKENIDCEILQKCLMTAVDHGNCDLIHIFLEAGIDINKTDDDGVSALHHACLNEDEDIIKKLLQIPSVNTNQTTNEGLTPLLISVFKNNRIISQLLLDAGACINKVTNLETMAIELCLGNIGIEQIDDILPIHMACLINSCKMAKLLIDRYAKCHTFMKITYKSTKMNGSKTNNINRLTPLFISVTSKNEDIVKLLLRNKVEIRYSEIISIYDGFKQYKTLRTSENYRNFVNVKVTPIQLACVLGYTKIVALLMNDNKSQINESFIVTPTVLALSSDTIVLIKTMSNKYGSDHVSYGTEITLLAYACLVQNVDLVHVLVDNCAEKNVYVKLSLLHLIALNQDLITLIVKYPRMPCLLRECTVNPLSISYLNENKDIIKLTMHKFTEWNCEIKLTALHVACFKGYVEIITEIINRELNAGTNFTLRVFHLACMTFCELSEDVDIFVKDSYCKNMDSLIKMSYLDFTCFTNAYKELSCILTKKLNVYTSMELSPLLLTWLYDTSLYVDCIKHSDLTICNRTSLYFLLKCLYPAEFDFSAPTEDISILFSIQEISSWNVVLFNCCFLNDDEFESPDFFLSSSQISSFDIVNQRVDQEFSQIIFMRKDVVAISKLLYNSKLLSDRFDYNLLLISCLQDVKLQDLSLKKTIVDSQCFNIPVLHMHYLIRDVIPNTFGETGKIDQVAVVSYLQVACLHENYSNVLYLLNNNVDTDTIAKLSASHFSCFKSFSFSKGIDKKSAKKVIKDSTFVSEVTALHVSCILGCEEIVKLLINYNCDVNIKAKLSPLHIACIKGEISFPIDSTPAAETACQISPLHIACFCENEYLIEMLIQRCACPDSVTKVSTLHILALNENFRSLVLPVNGDLLAATSDLTTLHVVCLTDQMDIIMILLNNIYNIDKFANIAPIHLNVEYCEQLREIFTLKSKFILTALHISCIRQNTEITETLIWRKANVNSIASFYIEVRINESVNFTTAASMKCAHIACLVQNASILQTVLMSTFSVDEICDLSPWVFACFEDSPLLVRMLLQDGLNDDSVLKLTPLHIACIKGNKDCVQLLLNAGADVNLTATMTPWHVVVYCNDQTTVEIGQKLSTKLKKSPLHISAERGDIEICKVLMSVSTCSKVENDIVVFYPWHLALYHGYSDVLQLLLSKPIVINKARFLFVFLLYLIRKLHSERIIPAMIKSTRFILLFPLYRYLMNFWGFSLIHRKKPKRPDKPVTVVNKDTYDVYDIYEIYEEPDYIEEEWAPPVPPKLYRNEYANVDTSFALLPTHSRPPPILPRQNKDLPAIKELSSATQ